MDKLGLLWRAIAISLLLHLLLLLQPGFGGRSPPPAAPSLMAMLRPSVQSPSMDKAILPIAPHVAHMPRPLTPKLLRENDPIGMPMTPSAALMSPIEAGLTSADIAADIASTADSAKSLDNTAGEMDATAGLDLGEAKKAYLFAIAAEARRVKKYPARAFAAGWEGTAEIQVTVAVGGNTQPPQLRKSSGYADLDNAALSFVGIALKRTPVPESLRGRAFGFLLPVSFTLSQ